MSDTVFSLSHAEFMGVFSPARREFLDESSVHTNELARGSLAAVEEGDDRAYVVPAIDFAVNVAIQACQRAELPDEMQHRAEAGAMVAAVALERAINQRVITSAYATNPFLIDMTELVREDDYRLAVHVFSALKSFSDGAFMQTLIMVSGGLRALNREGVDHDQANILDHSRQLELIGHIRAQREKGVHKRLGIPYAQVHHFNVTSGPTSETVELNRHTKTLLQQSIDVDSGCPTIGIQPVEGTSLYVLRFHEILKLFMSGNVQVSNSPTPIKRVIEKDQRYSLVTIDA